MRHSRICGDARKGNFRRLDGYAAVTRANFSLYGDGYAVTDVEL